jgi:PAS domain S-box-containing protein
MGIIEYDLKKNDFTYVNPKLFEIIGYDDDDNFNVKKFTKMIHPDDLEKFYDSYSTKDLEYRIYDKYGKLRWISSHKTSHYDGNGNLVSFRVWLDDITDKKMYENLIYEINVNFLNFTTDVQGNIEMLLETCCKLLNASIAVYCQKRMVMNQEKFMFLTSERQNFETSSEDFHKNYIMSEFFHEEHDFTQTIVDLRDFEYALTDPFIKGYDAKGCIGKLIKSEEKFNNAICVFFPKNPIITHQEVLVLFLVCGAIEIEQRRWQVQQHLEEQYKIKTDLLSRTSHELKTPLISIKGFTDLLLTLHTSKMDTDMISILDDIKEGSRRLEEIINSLLESSSLDQGKLELNRATEDLSFLIKFVVRDLRGLSETRDQKILFEVQEYLTASFDKERMYEVISNLLVNAIKYTPPGGEIRIRSEIKEKFYIISVEDNGIGLNEDEMTRIFKQFGKIERYGKGWDVDAAGSGLGLYISKKIVELHGGEIWVESEGRNKGSKFYFSVPII